jgi:hypothetical protein
MYVYICTHAGREAGKNNVHVCMSLFIYMHACACRFACHYYLLNVAQTTYLGRRPAPLLTKVITIDKSIKPSIFQSDLFCLLFILQSQPCVPTLCSKR